MNSRLALGGFLAWALGSPALPANDQPPYARADDPRNESPLRSTEVERLLPSLEARCRSMRDRQKAIHDGTRALHKIIEGSPNRSPGPKEQQTARELADKARLSILEATIVIKR